MMNGKPSYNGFCELRKNDDPWLFLAPVKVKIKYEIMVSILPLF